MTEDAMDVTTASVRSTDSKMDKRSLGSETFLKPNSLKSEKQVKCKSGSILDKDSVHSELKKKKKKLNKPKASKENKGDCEDATESVDSGCIADIAGDVTDWPQVEAAVVEERNYVLNLLSWLPDFQWVVPDLSKPKPVLEEEELSCEDEKKDPGKTTGKKKKKKELVGTKAMLRGFINQADELDNLRERYTEKLEELRKDRGSKRKTGKLQMKLKVLNRRNKRNSNRQRKLEQAEIFEHKHKAIEKKKKGKNKTTQLKKIFNEQGKLVFSKFDFSNDGIGTQTKKAKNLEHKVAQALKEREMRKQLQMEGNLKASAELKEIDGWSSALQRAEGAKVYDDLGLMQKSLKKKENRKKMSKKRWEERTETLDKKMRDKQTKRQENLNARKEAKLEKKGKKLKRKGHIVAGF